MKGQQAFEQVAVRAKPAQQIQRWGRGLVRFARVYPLGAGGLVICLLTIIVGIFCSQIAPYAPGATDYTVRLQGPTASHWFGNDELGRDLLSRVVHGARIAIQVSFFAIALGTTIGYLLGCVSAYVGGKFDLVFQRVIDMMMAFPAILLAMMLVAVLGAGLDKVIIAIAIVFIPGPGRIARGVVLSVKQNVYVDAALVIGASPLRVMLRHIIPNAMAAYLIVASAQLGSAILLEASLSFLGLGVPPPQPSWGGMLSGAAQTYAQIAPWLVIFPGVAIMLVVLAFNLFGDALRDIWDPRLRGR
ncbi:MAG: ABC transporter permease [Chloroflexota bacterium]